MPVALQLTSLSAALFVAFTTWYYANEAKEREEARIADEESRKKWDSLFDISVTRPESEPFSVFTDGAPWCKESRTVMDDLRKIIESPQDWKHGSSYFHVLFGPQGTGKSQILKLLFNESLDQLKRDPASNQSVYYLDLKDAFLTNCTDSEFVSERFLDFLDEIQNKAKSDGTRITLFVDTADCMSNVFPENRLAAVVRHLHETGKFAHVFLAFNDHKAYTQLMSGQPGLMEQHGFLNVPYLSDRKDLLAYAKQVRTNVEASGHGQLWDVPEEALVEILGGQFADYGRVQRSLLGGRGLLSTILKDLLSDSQERVERALCFYQEEITPLASSFLVTAEALIGGARMAVPAHVQKQLMDEGLMYRCQSTMTFMFPRDRAVMEALLRNRVHAKHLNLVRRQAKVRPLVLHAEPAAEIVEYQVKRAERSKRKEVLKSWIWWPWGGSSN
ncbi:hypothetical protein BCR44DRAFT_1323930 [Catenaria anguillulae PL171]|uniref:P-loop containing nucleoside triphosphate hydrolase protein n=1 Tax=Catenaria anguillulae PL171 TaxID=765915 RepID=A0A1Y2HZ18_9FUNG|nr:hypothetical protein BCR44DRAFT_1323930 [Catenaria anguillulae PL171]